MASGLRNAEEDRRGEGSRRGDGKKAMEMEAHAICRKARKAFTGDLRCENNVGQVKCK